LRDRRRFRFRRKDFRNCLGIHFLMTSRILLCCHDWKTEEAAACVDAVDYCDVVVVVAAAAVVVAVSDDALQPSHCCHWIEAVSVFAAAAVAAAKTAFVDHEA